METTYTDSPKKGEAAEFKKMLGKGLDYNHGMLTVDSINIVYSRENMYVEILDEIRRDERRAVIAHEKITLAEKAEFVKKLYDTDEELTAFTSLDAEDFVEYD